MEMRSNSKPLVQHHIQKCNRPLHFHSENYFMINNIKIKVLLEETAGEKENFVEEIILNNEDKIKQYEECKKENQRWIKGMIEMVEQEKRRKSNNKRMGNIVNTKRMGSIVLN